MTNTATPDQLLEILKSLISTAPPLAYDKPLSDSDRSWLGRAAAAIEASDHLPALISFRATRESVGTMMFNRDRLLLALNDAYFKTELAAPTALKGSFIPAGDTWAGYAGIVRLLQSDVREFLVVDPYMDVTFLTEIVPTVPVNASIRCLTAQRNDSDRALATVLEKWRSTASAARCGLEFRYAPPRALHDRLLILDSREVWLISQSIKDIAKRSPASLTRADAEMAEMKSVHYNALWEQSAEVVCSDI